ncbi:unnamed protein product [Closterium sp. NIES-64]|nr:unnamed protein product [Closterium sp. NIES-64]
MELLMTRATGRAYATDAALFDEEARAEPDVNEELRSKAEAQKAIAGVYQKENGRLADDLKRALVLITHLAKKTTQVDQSTLDWKKYTKDACDKFLFKKAFLNLNPDSADMLNALIRHAGYTPESAEGMQVAAIAKSQGKLKDAMERFNDRIGKIYRLCRVYALSRDPCVFMREKRTLKGELTFSEIDDFAKVCADFVKNQSDSITVSNWDVPILPTFLGGECNPLANTDDDPHFRGADGTQYDFNDLLDRSFCLMWRDETGAQHSAFFKARDGKEQGRSSSGFIDRLELDGSPVAPPLSAGSSILGSGGFKLLLAETRSCKGKDEDEFHLTIDGVVDIGISARVAHPLMQTVMEAQAHFNVHIARLNHTSGIHGVLGQTFRAEESRKVRSLRYRLLTRLLREAVEVESESGRGFLDGRTEDYITSDIRSADCMYAAAWRRGEHESTEGSDIM